MKIIQVYCDQTIDGGGWTISHRRADGSVDFFRDWQHYEQGFSNLQNEFWLGNENLFTMKLRGMYPQGNELRTDMINDKKITKFVSYQNFHITNSVTRYTLHENGFTSILTDALTAYNRKKFSTFDADNDDRNDCHCASVYSVG